MTLTTSPFKNKWNPSHFCSTHFKKEPNRKVFFFFLNTFGLKDNGFLLNSSKENSWEKWLIHNPDFISWHCKQRQEEHHWVKVLTSDWLWFFGGSHNDEPNSSEFNKSNSQGSVSYLRQTRMGVWLESETSVIALLTATVAKCWAHDVFMYFTSDNYAKLKCSQLIQTNGIFSKCHDDVDPQDYYAVSQPNSPLLQ